MLGLSTKELAAVAAVGLALTYTARKVPYVKAVAHPLVLGSVLYTVGYIAAVKYPPGSYPALQG